MSLASDRRLFVVMCAALGLVAGCTTTVAAPPASPSWTIPAFVRSSGTCWELTAANGKDRVHLLVPPSFAPDLDPLKAPGASPALRWADGLGRPDYRAVGVYDVTASANGGNDEEALRWGAADFLAQAWGVVQPAVVGISEWSGVPGGRTGSQIYPTSDSTVPSCGTTSSGSFRRVGRGSSWRRVPHVGLKSRSWSARYPPPSPSEPAPEFATHRALGEVISPNASWSSSPSGRALAAMTGMKCSSR